MYNYIIFFSHHYICFSVLTISVLVGVRSITHESLCVWHIASVRRAPSLRAKISPWNIFASNKKNKWDFSHLFFEKHQQLYELALSANSKRWKYASVSMTVSLTLRLQGNFSIAQTRRLLPTR